MAWVLLIVYGLTLLFSLGTHRTLYAVAEADLGEAVRHGHGGGDDASATPRPPLLPWLAVLVGTTVGLAYASEQFVGVVEPVTERVGLTPIFTGVILLPLLGGIAEYLTAVTMARKDKMDLSVSVALGSTLLFALLVVPLLVLVGPLLGHPLDLSFNVYELVAIITAVVVSNLVSLDGRSDWLEGVLLAGRLRDPGRGLLLRGRSDPMSPSADGRSSPATDSLPADASMVSSESGTPAFRASGTWSRLRRSASLAAAAPLPAHAGGGGCWLALAGGAGGQRHPDPGPAPAAATALPATSRSHR